MQTKFLRDISAKIQQYGNRTRLSEKQLAKVKEALSRASIKGPDSAETADPQSAAESIQHTSNRRNSPPKASAPKSPQRKRPAGSSGSRQARTVRRALGLPSPLVLGSVAIMVLYLALFGGDNSYDPAPQASWQPASTTPTTYSQSTRSGVTKYPRPSERKTTARLPDTSPTSPTPARSVASRNASPPSVAKAPPPHRQLARLDARRTSVSPMAIPSKSMGMPRVRASSDLTPRRHGSHGVSMSDSSVSRRRDA